jgi:hypothetical protein
MFALFDFGNIRAVWDTWRMGKEWNEVMVLDRVGVMM